MNIRKLELLHEIITEQMNHWLLYPIALTVMGSAERYMNHPGPNVTLWALCGLFPVLFFLIRDRSKRFLPFLLLHLAAAAPAFFIAPFKTVEFFLCAACGIGYLVHSFLIKMRDEEPYTEPLHIVFGLLVSAVFILLLHYQRKRDWDFYFVIALVCVFALYALTLYIRQYLEFLSVNESSAGYLPVSEMFRSGFGLVTGYSILGMVLLILLGNIGNYDGLEEAIKRWGQNILRKIASLFRTPNPEHETLTEAEMLSSEFLPTEAGSPGLHLFWRILEIVGLVVLSAALAYFLIRGIIFLVRFLRERFSRLFARKKNEQESLDVVDVREWCGTSLNEPVKRRKFAELLSFEQRIRRLYKKHIRDSAQTLTKGDIRALRFLTPRECGQRLKEEQMAVIYEQTRYSNREATQDTLRQMKNALHRPKGE